MLFITCLDHEGSTILSTHKASFIHSTPLDHQLRCLRNYHHSRHTRAHPVRYGPTAIPLEVAFHQQNRVTTEGTMHTNNCEHSCHANATSLKVRSSWITSSYTDPTCLGVCKYTRKTSFARLQGLRIFVEFCFSSVWRQAFERNDACFNAEKARLWCEIQIVRRRASTQKYVYSRPGVTSLPVGSVRRALTAFKSCVRVARFCRYV